VLIPRLCLIDKVSWEPYLWYDTCRIQEYGEVVSRLSAKATKEFSNPSIIDLKSGVPEEVER